MFYHGTNSRTKGFKKKEKEKAKYLKPAININPCSSRLYDLAKRGNQRLSQPEAENKLGPGHEQLRCETLKETGQALIFHHVRHNAEARLWVLEIAVLDTSLDHIQGSRHDQRGTGTTDRCHKILRPGSRIIIPQVIDVFLGESGTTKQLYYKLASKHNQQNFQWS